MKIWKMLVAVKFENDFSNPNYFDLHLVYRLCWAREKKFPKVLFGAQIRVFGHRAGPIKRHQKHRQSDAPGQGKTFG